MDIISKALIAALLWYICHKFIRKGLNPNMKWTEDKELDARLGGLAAASKEVIKWMIF
jgi:hypothetical protein